MKQEEQVTSDRVPRVAIIGANGQVGAEVCLFLKAMGKIEPVAITRSSYSTALLRRIGIECRVGQFSSIEQGRKLLKDCDAVFDLSWPMGASPAETKKVISLHLERVFDSLGDIKCYIFASTTSVYKIDSSQPFYRWYGASKRYAERQARKLACRTGCSLYVLRLGQVHGEMQSCSLNILEGLHEGVKVRLPDIPSYSIFVFSVAEALINIMGGMEKPGIYTLVSTPAWSWKEVVLWFAETKSVNCEIALYPFQSTGLMKSIGNAFIIKVRGIIFNLALFYKDLISAVLSTLSEDLEKKYRHQYSVKQAKNEISIMSRVSYWEPVNQHLPMPGQRLTSLSNSKETMQPFVNQVREWLSDLVPKTN